MSDDFEDLEELERLFVPDRSDNKCGKLTSRKVRAGKVAIENSSRKGRGRSSGSRKPPPITLAKPR